MTDATAPWMGLDRDAPVHHVGYGKVEELIAILAARITASEFDAVVGISRDAPEKLRAFRERDGLTYDLLSDPDHAVHEAYGAWGEKMNYGKLIKGVIRSTFVVNKDGAIAHALYNVKATGHVARLRKQLGIDS